MHESEPELVVLQALRCTGFADEARILAGADLPPSQVRALLDRFLQRGLVRKVDGPFGGWGLSESGRSTVEKMVASELDSSGMRESVHGAYRRFLDLNPPLLQTCGDWQMRTLGGSRMINDHSDPAYDARVLARLARINDAVQPLCDELASSVTRFDWYGARLSRALERAMEGQVEFVADSLDSYHSVWFRLHEDLLVTLGISREDERNEV